VLPTFLDSLLELLAQIDRLAASGSIDNARAAVEESRARLETYDAPAILATQIDRTA
jgi:hypothetical protein